MWAAERNTVKAAQQQRTKEIGLKMLKRWLLVGKEDGKEKSACWKSERGATSSDSADWQMEGKDSKKKRKENAAR